MFAVPLRRLPLPPWRVHCPREGFYGRWQQQWGWRSAVAVDAPSRHLRSQHRCQPGQRRGTRAGSSAAAAPDVRLVGQRCSSGCSQHHQGEDARRRTRGREQGKACPWRRRHSSSPRRTSSPCWPRQSGNWALSLGTTRRIRRWASQATASSSAWTVPAWWCGLQGDSGTKRARFWLAWPASSRRASLSA